MLNWSLGLVLQVFDLMRKQEQTRLAESEAEKNHHQAIQAQSDIVSYIHLRTLVILWCYYFKHNYHTRLAPSPFLCCALG